jgi:opacity protein-like surface antigen
VEAQRFSWTGYYFGAHLGGGLGRAEFSDPYGPSIYGDHIRAPDAALGLQGGYNWQSSGSNWVYGGEVDLTWLGGSGSSTCFAYSGSFISSNCTMEPDFTGSLAGRLGYAAGPSGRTLLYGKVGGAFLQSSIDTYVNNTYPGAPRDKTGDSSTRWGWLLGAGVEQAISPAWSAKFEYDYVGLGSQDVMTAASVTGAGGASTGDVGARTASVDQNQQTLKLGLNYRLGTDPHAVEFIDGPPSGAAPYALPAGWRFQPAMRYWYSVGRFQKDLPPHPSASSKSLISRLTYDDVVVNSGELYGRIDTPWRVFVQGFIGAGGIASGHMNDEDWAFDNVTYSNTISRLRSTNMRYAVLDAGYDVMRGQDYRGGLFVGWAHNYEKYPATSCLQIGEPAPGEQCETYETLPFITETDTWDAVRLGVAADVWLTPALQLTGNFAYLPQVWFDGRDDHWLRNLLIKEHGGGQGTQLELLLSYYLTQDFSLGVGGRYWAAWADGGDIFGGEPMARSDTYRYERAGVFLQGAYTFDSCCVAHTDLK